MISTRLPRHPGRSTAVAIRLAAVLVPAASVVVIPVAIVEAIMGHATVAGACATAAVAATLTLFTGLAARVFDPLRS